MEGSGKSVSAVLRLPLGFRFYPTDEELVVLYLKRKAFNLSLPANVIPEVDLSKFDPWNLPGDSKEDRYFFTLKAARYRNGKRSIGAANSGYWKATGVDKKITAQGGDQTVGLKKVFVFHKGKPGNRSKTNWIMHEYRLAETPAQENVEDWVVCRIFKKKRSTKKNGGRVRRGNGANYTDMAQQADSSSLSSSSCVTELSADESRNEEEEADSRNAAAAAST